MPKAESSVKTEGRKTVRIFSPEFYFSFIVRESDLSESHIWLAGTLGSEEGSGGEYREGCQRDEEKGSRKGS